MFRRPKRVSSRMARGLVVAAAASLLVPAAARGQEPPPPVDREGAQAIVREVRRITQPEGIEELRAVEIGGVKQWISVRGRDRRNPILLFIHGGPASTEMPVSWAYQGAWEDFFTVVQWDQRGAGKTAAANDMARIAPSITVERMVADAEQMVEHLRTKYGKRRIFILGHSWGTVLGLEIARRRPEWLHAYVGMGQVVHATENERLGYAFALRSAREQGNKDAVRELESIAPYPPADGSLSVPQILAQRKWVMHFGGMTWGRQNFDYDQRARLLAPEYEDADLRAQQLAGASLMQLLPALKKLDVRHVERIDCPVFVFAGRHDFAVPSSIAASWLAKLRAPQKEIVWFEKSGHMMHLEEPGRVLMTLVNKVRPIAERAGDVPTPTTHAR